MAEKFDATKSILKWNYPRVDFISWHPLKVGFVMVTSRSIKYFGFLVGIPNGSSVENGEQIEDTRYVMLILTKPPFFNFASTISLLNGFTM